MGKSSVSRFGAMGRIPLGAKQVGEGRLRLKARSGPAVLVAADALQHAGIGEPAGLAQARSGSFTGAP